MSVAKGKTISAEHPILFSGPMVNAILSGAKTQTRRVITPQPTHFHQFGNGPLPCKSDESKQPSCAGEIMCRFGKPGDRLWVRETWQRHPEVFINGPGGVIYRADRGGDYQHPEGKWRRSIFMPRWASRITLEITEVRVERLQDISDGDVSAEGIFNNGGIHLAHCQFHVFHPDQTCECGDRTLPECFAIGWNTLNAKRGYGWDVNPWVWVIEFNRKERAVSY